MRTSVSAAICTFVVFFSMAYGAPAQHLHMGPPPPPPEAIPAVPAAHPNWAWRGGYYRWHGNRYVWVPGAYVRPPHVGYRWYPGHWRQTRHGWVWVAGHWR
ncbi:YXWGXW repeat-containing protein [Edaphobacter sp. HDX4]|uniref:hypothetical protein n=1 Tax=Edaphobacter sp. HDX4 TaxID=2794064 RepID=UPI002FE612BC